MEIKIIQKCRVYGIDNDVLLNAFGAFGRCVYSNMCEFTLYRIFIAENVYFIYSFNIFLFALFVYLYITAIN